MALDSQLNFHEYIEKKTMADFRAIKVLDSFVRAQRT